MLHEKIYEISPIVLSIISFVNIQFRASLHSQPSLTNSSCYSSPCFNFHSVLNNPIAETITGFGVLKNDFSCI